MSVVVLHPEKVSVDGHLFYRDAQGNLASASTPVASPFYITVNGVSRQVTPTEPADSVGGWKEEALGGIRQRFGLSPTGDVTMVLMGETVVATVAQNNERFRVHAGDSISG